MLVLYVPKFLPLTDENGAAITEEKGKDISIGDGGEYVPLNVDDYYIKELASGLDELHFELSIEDPLYAVLQELSQIIDGDGQRYLVRKIDGGKSTATVVGQIDLDEWKEGMMLGYSNGSATVLDTIQNILPAGWSVLDYSGISSRRTVSGNMTPYDVLMKCIGTYGVYLRFDIKNKTVKVYPQAPAEPSGAFATRQLNMTEIQYKGSAKHEDFCTRLYAYGKDGLSFADINGGLPYVDNFEYCGRIISAVWEDERYTVAENLLEDATRKLREMAVPSRAYECKVVDLRAVDPQKYGNLNFDLFTTALLVDDIRGTSVNYQVVERWRYPHYPEKNNIIFSSVPVSVQNQVVQIREALENPNSDFRQEQAALIDSATSYLTSADGYLVVVLDAEGNWKELLAMDTPDMATAQNVLRLNNNGIGFSTTGTNGPYRNAWTIDGNLIADFVTAGTMAADRIRGGSLQLGGVNNQDGVLIMTDSTGSEIGRWDMSGITATAGQIGGWTVTANGLSCSFVDQQNQEYAVYITIVPDESSTLLRVVKGGELIFYIRGDGAVSATNLEAAFGYVSQMTTDKNMTNSGGTTYTGVNTSFSTPSGMFLTVKNGIIVSAT